MLVCEAACADVHASVTKARKMRSACMLIGWVLAMIARSQFPIDQPLTGDTNLLQVLPSRPFASYPTNDGLFVPYSGTRMLHLEVDGTVISDQSLSTLPLSTYGTCNDASGALMFGKTSGQNAFIGRLNESGTGFTWIDSIDYGNETYFSGVTVLDDGDLLVCGTSYVMGTDLRPIIRRLTADGDGIWTHVAPTGQITRATHARELQNGDFIVTGLDGPPVPSAIKLLCGRYSSTGSWVSFTDLGNGGFQQGLEVMEAVDGGSIIWGRQDSPMNLIIAKVNDQCVLQWAHYFSGYEFQDACADAMGDGYYATGRYPNGGALVARFDASGDTLWTRHYGTPGTRGRHIRPDGFGDYFITGWSEDVTVNNDPVPYFLRVDPNGLVMGHEAPGSTPAFTFHIAPNPSGSRTSLITDGRRSSSTWEVLDALGRPRCSGVLAGEGPYLIGCDGMSSGTHIVRLHDADGSIGTVRWMVE